MMKKYRFYQELDGRWYVDLPAWTGLKEELEMVSGADQMLKRYAAENDEVTLFISTTAFDGADVAELIRLGELSITGATYLLKTFEGKPLDMQFWLCHVTLFVFGEYPPKLYFKKK